MKLRNYIVIAALSLIPFFSKAQTSRAPGSPTSPESTIAREHAHHRNIFSRRKFTPYKFKRGKVTHSAQYEYYKRVEAAAKAHQRALKKLYKPQYSNFLYYGHKRKPKKHSADKLRYCSVCGIRH